MSAASPSDSLPPPVPPPPLDVHRLPRPARGRASGLAVVVIVVVVVAFLAGLFAGGYRFSGGSSPGSSSSPAWDYAQAAAVAAAKANATGGSWKEIIAAGIDTPHGTMVPASGSAGCALSGFYLPGYSGSYSAGLAPFWLFEYLENPSSIAPPELIVEVLNGSATVIANIPQGTSCTEQTGGTAVLPGNVLDSPKVMASAAAAGGTSFLASEPNATVAFEVYGAPAMWAVAYTPCGLFGAGASESGTQTTFSATFNATAGGQLSVSTGTSTCVAARPYTIGLSAGASGVLPSGAYFDSFSVVINAPLPLYAMTLWMQTSTGAAVYAASSGCTASTLNSCPDPGAGWYAVLDSGGTLQATYPGPGLPLPEWEGIGLGSILNIQTGETFSLVSTNQLAGTGDVLAMLGYGGAVVNSQTTL